MEEYDQELIHQFVTECQELIDEAEPLLVLLSNQGEKDCLSIEDINAIFRLFHSIKGSAGFLQFTQISTVTHHAETLLDSIRKKQIRLTINVGKALIGTCDHLRILLHSVADKNADTGHEKNTGVILELLNDSVAGQQNQAVEKPEKPAAPATPEKEADIADAIINGTPPPDAPVSPVVSDDMIKLYIQDSEEMLDQAENDIIQLEKTPGDAGVLLQNAFRALHTFKGNSGLMCYDDLEAISHRMESVLQDMRDGTLDPHPELLQLLLKVIDMFRSTVTAIANGADGRITGKVGWIDLLDDQTGGAVTPPADKPTSPPPSAPGADESAAPAAGGAQPAPAAGRAERSATAQQHQKTIRVSVDKLDQLSNLVGEMVIYESMVTNSSDLTGLKLDNFRSAAHHLNLITSELQDIAMALRMAPIEATLKKLIRLTHDVASKTNKKVELQLLGTETEVDRTVAEWIADPLVHMVRNCIDHGIELPAERRKLGKPENGKIVVEARHQAGEIWIIVRDDGHGLDAEKIRARAVERKLLDEEAARRMTQTDLYTMIFEPGFSTAAQVTDVSGRGVGMDVVKKNMEHINGRIEIQSTLNEGTVVTMRIPLTLAIINGMVIRVGAESLIIPLLMIRESFRPAPGAISTITGRGEAILLRGELIPVFRLCKLFDIANAESDPLKAILMVLEASGRKAAILVDELLGQQQVVIKSLDAGLGHIEGVSGASIMSDGRVALILDVEGLIRFAQT